MIPEVGLGAVIGAAAFLAALAVRRGEPRDGMYGMFFAAIGGAGLAILFGAHG